MKRYYYLVLLLLFFQICYSQDTIRIEDILKRHTKENQSNKSSNQVKQSNNEKGVILNVFKQAIQASVYLVEIQYHLVKDNKVYGKGDDDFFGSTQAVAISNGKQLLIDPTKLEPWNIDPDYMDYKNEYTPELYKIKISEYSKALSSEYTPNQFTYSVHNGIGSINFKIKSFKGIDVTEKDDQAGFIILYSESKKGNEPEVEMNFYEKGLPKNKNSFNQESLLGGFYFHIIPSDGKVECKLAGIVVKNNKGKAELILINEFLSSNSNSSSSDEIKSSKDKPSLKEVKSKK